MEGSPCPHQDSPDRKVTLYRKCLGIDNECHYKCHLNFACISQFIFIQISKTSLFQLWEKVLNYYLLLCYFKCYQNSIKFHVEFTQQIQHFCFMKWKCPMLNSFYIYFFIHIIECLWFVPASIKIAHCQLIKTAPSVYTTYITLPLQLSLF